jgi:hypothetical protein
MVELRPFTKEDIPRLIDWVDSPGFLLQWGGPTFAYPLDESQLEQHLKGSAGEEPLTKELAFGQKVCSVKSAELGMTTGVPV